MYEDALRRRMAHESRVGMFLGPGERHEWSVTAMCLDSGAGTDNEGYLTMTDRRLAFYPDAADPLLPPSESRTGLGLPRSATRSKLGDSEQPHGTTSVVRPCARTLILTSGLAALLPPLSKAMLCSE